MCVYVCDVCVYVSAFVCVCVKLVGEAKIFLAMVATRDTPETSDAK